MVVSAKTQTINEFNSEIRLLLKLIANEYKTYPPINKRRLADECNTALRKFALATKVMNDSAIDLMAPLFIYLAPLIEKRDTDGFKSLNVAEIGGVKMDAEDQAFLSLLQLTIHVSKPEFVARVGDHMIKLLDGARQYSN